MSSSATRAPILNIIECHADHVGGMRNAKWMPETSDLELYLHLDKHKQVYKIIAKKIGCVILKLVVKVEITNCKTWTMRDTICSTLSLKSWQFWFLCPMNCSLNFVVFEHELLKWKKSGSIIFHFLVSNRLLGLNLTHKLKIKEVWYF
jgi:hypothetical protein